jgi:purine-binding chemotaxis protein CheW
MAHAEATHDAPHPAAHGGAAKKPAPTTFVTMMVCDQLCGLPLQDVREIVVTQSLTRVPLASGEIAGSLNLRGRIVTAIDLRRRLDLPPRPGTERGMSVVVERGGELYSLLVDEVREVLDLEGVKFESDPPTLAAVWRDNSNGICCLDHELLVILDTDRVLAVG